MNDSRPQQNVESVRMTWWRDLAIGQRLRGQRATYPRFFPSSRPAYIEGRRSEAHVEPVLPERPCCDVSRALGATKCIRCGG